MHGTVLRSRQSQSSQSKPKNRIEEEWTAAFPGISDPIIQERVFKDGSEYVYLYDSQILTGMPDIHYQFSGARIRAVVRIQLGEKDVMQVGNADTEASAKNNSNQAKAKITKTPVNYPDKFDSTPVTGNSGQILGQIYS